MLPKFTLAEQAVLGSVPDNLALQPIDWTKCIICQKETNKLVRHPSHSNRVDKTTGYKSFVTNWEHFKKLGCLPVNINLLTFDDGPGIVETLKNHNAGWHKSCILKFNNTQLHRAEKRKAKGHPLEEECTPTKYTRQSNVRDTPKIEETSICFFCDEVNSTEDLHNASTMQMDAHVRQYAHELQDKHLLAKLSAGDLVAQGAKYHKKCLTDLYNKVKSWTRAKQDREHEDIIGGIALAELIAHIEEQGEKGDSATVFKLSDLTKTYLKRLEQLGAKSSVDFAHSTRLKRRILTQIPQLKEHKQGREILLAFDSDVGNALKKAYETNYDDEAIILARAARIVRRDMFNTTSTFNGSFKPDCQKDSIPTSLLTLTKMILDGPNVIDSQEDCFGFSQANLTMSQLLLFNSHLRRRKGTSASHHAKERETLLPVFIGISIHTKTRKRELVDLLHKYGLSISYDRVLAISTGMANGIIHKYAEEGAVVPPKLCSDLFTTAAVDNIDHNPSSTTAHDSFHGTGISLFQHPDNVTCTLAHGKVMFDDSSSKKTVPPLPDSYLLVPPVSAIKKNKDIPKLQGPLRGSGQKIKIGLYEERKWLDHVNQMIYDDCEQNVCNISWAAYHASQQRRKDIVPSLSALLPLFPDKATSAAMIQHAMDVIKMAVERLNPGQTPVIAFDQPLYAIAKEIQWNWAERYGEDHFIIMFGALHIEMNILKMLGNWLSESGWTSALCQADISSEGVADSFLKGLHVTRTRHAHQITASALFILQTKAYNDYKSKASDNIRLLSFDDWCELMSNQRPQFKYWSLTLKLQCLLLVFIRSIREANFSLYVDAITELIPWLCALDHTHYSRWLPVHVRDMITLKDRHPAIHAEFIKGNFVVQKTVHLFSGIGIDQAHEQNNKIIKGDGGAIGLTGNPIALCRWMVAGPEMARVISEFEGQNPLVQSTDSDFSNIKHHEQTRSIQVNFFMQVKSLVHVMEKMGNPFMDDSGDLLALDTRNIASKKVTDTVNTIEKLGQQQYEKILNERLIDNKASIFDTISKNNLALFNTPASKSSSHTKLQLAALKSDCALFAHLYVSCQTRDGDLDDFFRHENQSCPPSLSKGNQIFTGTKSDLLLCLEKVCQSHQKPPEVEVIILDGAAILNILKPGGHKTFADFAYQVFIPYIRYHFQFAKRIDIVWDRYLEDSLKMTTRNKRGNGIRRRVEANSHIPKNWTNFLRNSENKVELFHFLAKVVTGTTFDEGKFIISTHDCDVLSNSSIDIPGLAPCSHEEADTRMLLHAADAAKQGFSHVTIRTVDTDVVVLSIMHFEQLHLEELWVAFGVGNNFRYIPVHHLAERLGKDKSRALGLFHAITGCDSVSAFVGRGKKTAWDTWNMFHDVSHAFLSLCSVPEFVDVECMDLIEHFVVLLYDKTSAHEKVNEARKDLFTKGRTIDCIPPTEDALKQHVLRAVFQAGHIWGQALLPNPQLPSPANWGWSKNSSGEWSPVWTTISQASSSCKELLKCGCKTGCKRNCRCSKAALRCTALCFCKGACSTVW